MSTLTIVLLVILIILIGALIALYFFGKKAQKKQEEQQAQIEAAKQTVSMLIIDKKRLPLKESGLKRQNSHGYFTGRAQCQTGCRFTEQRPCPVYQWTC